jgi:RimJ/RimL family protein N-acetyltransferase
MLFKSEKVTLKNNVEVTFRSASPSDAEKINEAFTIIAKDSPYILITPESIQKRTIQGTAKWINETNDSANSILILAEIDSRIIGISDFGPFRDVKRSHRGNLGVMLIPEFRGQGLGFLMMKFLLEQLTLAQDILSVELNVMSPNVVAHRIYSKLGFKETGRTYHGYKLLDGTFADDIAMQFWISR